MSFCWQDEPSSFQLDSTVDQLARCAKSHSNQELLLKSHLESQFGIISPELVPLVASCLALPTAAKGISFSQILNYKQLLVSAIDRQHKFLADTGVKLEAYYSTLPSGYVLDDREFEDHLCKALFDEELPENSVMDHASPPSSVISGVASPIWNGSPFLNSSVQRPLKRMGSDFRLKQSHANQLKDSKFKRGYQKHHSGRTIFPIREASLEQLSPAPHFDANLTEASEPLNDRAQSSWLGSDELNGPEQSASPGLLSPRELSVQSKRQKNSNTALRSFFEGQPTKKSESLALELRKAENSHPTAEAQLYGDRIEQQQEYLISGDEEEELPGGSSPAGEIQETEDRPDTPHLPGAAYGSASFDFGSHPDRTDIGFAPQKEEPDRLASPKLLALKFGKKVDTSSDSHPKTGTLERSSTLDEVHKGVSASKPSSRSKSPSRRDRLESILAPRVDWNALETSQDSRIRQSVTLTALPSPGLSLQQLKEEFKLPVLSKGRVQVWLASPDPPGPVSLRKLET